MVVFTDFRGCTRGSGAFVGYSCILFILRTLSGPTHRYSYIQLNNSMLCTHVALFPLLQWEDAVAYGEYILPD